MNTATVDSPLRRNPVFWIMVLIPGITVIAGLSTLGIALRHADPPLPAAYHWEGEHLDQDFAQQRLAAAHGTQVWLSTPAAAGAACTARVSAAPDDAATLTLLFTNASDPGLDRVVLLQRVGAGDYRGECAPIPSGRWRVALEAGQWSIRTQLVGRVDQLTLRARDPGGAL